MFKMVTFEARMVANAENLPGPCMEKEPVAYYGSTGKLNGEFRTRPRESENSATRWIIPAR
jgi:hypothetical protein